MYEIDTRRDNTPAPAPEYILTRRDQIFFRILDFLQPLLERLLENDTSVSVTRSSESSSVQVNSRYIRQED